MENKNKNNSQKQSSLLFNLPNSMLSLNDMSTSNVLLPVAVYPNEGQSPHKREASKEPNPSSKTTSIGVNKSVCQLEQPLFVKKESQKPSPSIPSQVSTEPSPHVGATSLGFSEVPISSTYDSNPMNNSDSEVSFYEEVFHKNLKMETASVPNSKGGIGFGIPVSTSAPVLGSGLDHVNSGYAGEPTVELFRPYVSSNQISGSSNDPPQFLTDTYSSSGHQQRISNVDTYDQSNTPFDYVPVNPHWLFEEIVETKEVWYGFNEVDSKRLEEAYVKGENIVATDGGRYDVHLHQRLKKSVYFDGKDLHVRRGTWFYETGSSLRYRPYDEDVSVRLEQQYFTCVNSGNWQRRFNIPGIGSFLFESAQVMLHYKNELEVWPNLLETKDSPKVVKRGLPDGFEILPVESSDIDHLVFVVQGIGSFCDLRFRTVSQCVDGFRDIANKLVDTHYKSEVEQKRVGRVEFLPVAWHAKLHTREMGLDKRMQNITLPSIPKLRHFTNDTLIDILLYSNQSYCQSIIDTVASELNSMYELFLFRNPYFTGKVFVAGHSLGSLILFDLLSNQVTSEDIPSHDTVCSQVGKINKECGMEQLLSASFKTMSLEDIDTLLKYLDLKEPVDVLREKKISIETLERMTVEELNELHLKPSQLEKLKEIVDSEKSPINSFIAKLIFSSLEDEDENAVEELDDVPKSRAYPAKKFISSMSLISYPRLKFQPAGFFALGSPIPMFLAARGYDSLSADFQFPTCPAFFHIFHPYDPVAFRIEPLIDSNFTAKPVLIPHHKGRKRMHLEIKENVTKIASEIKQKLMDTMRYTWYSLSEFAKNHSFPSAMLEAEVDKLVSQEMTEPVESSEISSEDIQIGMLNGGRRIDYVLQEKPIEALNDYVFALTSHATYWDSEDTVLMILREIYAMQGIVISTHQIEDKPLPTKITPDNTPVEFIATSSQSSKVIETPQFFDRGDIGQMPPYNVPPPFHTPLQNSSNASEVNASVLNPQSSTIPVSNLVGPPPLSGFVKRSAFTR